MSKIVFNGKRNESVMEPGIGATVEQRTEYELAVAQAEAFRLTELRATEFREKFNSWLNAFHMDAGKAGPVPVCGRAVVVEMITVGREFPRFDLIDSEHPACDIAEFGGSVSELVAELRRSNAAIKNKADDVPKVKGGK